MKALGALLFAIAFVSRCALCPSIDFQQKLIMNLDDYMIQLAKTVDVVVDKLLPDAKDQEILSATVQRSGNSPLLKPFEGYALKTPIQEWVRGQLLSSKDGKEGIIIVKSNTASYCKCLPSGNEPLPGSI